ncbi:hypothetical protein [Ramlibacter rhizophilus]|uniref:Uncharacterized protein n=1 Tax=Ramlibacter rhizophilus TaxID=1781167 RepID=A0A4Z0BSZ6_9BURK|nr:hypothetical protein [Ramlibacter rhizophilus]TFZ01584.1 hypothetical protein EZ242_09455 [Ramlibacter rhizophilus]
MGPIDFLIHLFNFVLPALALGLVLPLAGRWLGGSRRLVVRYWPQVGVCVGAGVAVLLLGLWGFGRDGKMATYGALVLAVATVQWLMAGGWRR